jgi:hypothetical protein
VTTIKAIAAAVTQHEAIHSTRPFPRRRKESTKAKMVSSRAIETQPIATMLIGGIHEMRSERTAIAQEARAQLFDFSLLPAATGVAACASGGESTTCGDFAACPGDVLQDSQLERKIRLALRRAAQPPQTEP